MASFTTEVPDGLVDDLVQALARYMGVVPPTTNAAKIKLAQDFTKSQLKNQLVEYRANQACQSARTNPNDPAVTW